MIYISYGVTKSASTFLYQLTEEVLRSAGRKPAVLSTAIKGRASPENYVDPINGAALNTVRAEVQQNDVVIKTHGAPDSLVLTEVNEGRILASAVIRDPREIALSIVDHGTRSRFLGIADFSQFTHPIDTLDTLKEQIVRFSRWTSSSRVLVFTYDQVCFNTADTIKQIATQIGVSVEPAVVEQHFADRTSIGQFNKGKRNRYTELSEQDQSIFCHAFPELYVNGVFRSASTLATIKTTLHNTK